VDEAVGVLGVCENVEKVPSNDSRNRRYVEVSVGGSKRSIAMKD